MSLVPLLFSNWWEDLDTPHHVLDQNFGLGLYPDQLLASRRLENYLQELQYQQKRNQLQNYIRPLAELLRNTDKGGASTVTADKNQFQVTLDVQQFKPDELEIKVAGRQVIVNAKHEEKRDEHGWISRQFTRKYLIPEQCEIEKVTSKLSSDGVLTIIAPRKEEPNKKNEKVIQIQHTGQPAVRTNEKAAVK